MRGNCKDEFVQTEGREKVGYGSVHEKIHFWNKIFEAIFLLIFKFLMV